VNGLVLVFFSTEHHATEEQLELAGHVAGAARGALERSELFELERRSRALAQRLAEAGRELASELDPENVLERAVMHAAALLDAAAAAVWVLEADELVVHAAAGEGVGPALETRVPSTALLLGDIVQSRRPTTIADAADDDRAAETDPILAAGYTSYLGVPAIGPDGSVQGVLSVYDRSPRDWREEEADALLALASSSAAARANAEQYQAVRHEQQRSDAILANVADGIVAVDRDGKVVLWNPAAEEITGVPAAEAVGRTPAQVLGRSLASDGGGPAVSRLVPIRRGGEEAWLSVSEAVMTDPAGAIAGRIYAFRDISAERAVEQMKSDFVSTVSHELRTPLTSIFGFAETLLRQDVLFGEAERETFLRYISSESERLTAIVDRLLSVAQLDTGAMSVQIAETEVGRVVADVMDAAEEKLGANDHHFVLALEEGPLAAQADPEKLKQVLSHLLDNAVRYSPAGGRVTVGARRAAGAVEVRVEDEGVGIPRAEQERIFRKFYRGESTARTAGAGATGLGLFLAQGLVQAMGGRIWVDSDEGRGATFVVELPAAGE
jgi:two-component system phosphate regulon sensor histidine kinase PhoR